MSLRAGLLLQAFENPAMAAPQRLGTFSLENLEEPVSLISWTSAASPRAGTQGAPLVLRAQS